MIFAFTNSSSKNEKKTVDNSTTEIVLQKPLTTGVTKPSTTKPKTTEGSTVEPTTKPTTQTSTATTTKPTTQPSTAPAPKTTTPQTTSYSGDYITHIVASGDNYYSILRQYGISDTPSNVDKFCAANGVTPNDGLEVGQVLKVPSSLK